MIVTNTYQITMSGETYELKKYFVQINSRGGASAKPLYAFEKADGMTRDELIGYLTKKIAYKFENTPNIEKKAKSIALHFLAQLEAANDEIEVRPRRVDCGAPSLGRTGIPTRPLAYA